MTDATRSLAAGTVTAAGIATQAVLGFTALGARIAAERTTLISVIGLTTLLVILVWVSGVESPRAHRRIFGIAATCVTAVVTVLLLAAAWEYHNAVIEQDRRGKLTITTLRAALTPADIEVTFFSDSGVPITFDGYQRSSRNLLIERKGAGTKFVLRNFGRGESVTLRHYSAQPLTIEREAAKFIRKNIIRRNIAIAATIGAFACLVMSILIWWLSRSSSASDRRKPAGFHIEASSSTQAPKSR